MLAIAARSWPLLIGACFLLIYGWIGRSFLERGLFEHQNLLFDADVVRVTNDITQWTATHWRSSVHPIFPLTLLPLGAPASQLLPATEVALALVALAGAMAVTLTGATLRTFLPELDAALLTLLYASSASSLFMFSIIDTFAFSALGISAIWLAARTRASAGRTLASSVLGFGCVVTNLVHVALAELTVPRSTMRERVVACMRLSVLTVGVTASLAALQWFVVPNTQHFLFPGALLKEWRYVADASHLAEALARAERVLVGFAGHSFVAPEPELVRHAGLDVAGMRFADPIAPAAYGTSSGALALLVVGLLCWAGAVSLTRGRRPEMLAVAAATGVHLAIMLVYGSEPLLYSPLWVHSLVLWLGLALADARRKGLGTPPRWLLALVALLALASNTRVAMDIAHHYDTGLQAPRSSSTP